MLFSNIMHLKMLYFNNVKYNMFLVTSVHLNSYHITKKSVTRLPHQLIIVDNGNHIVNGILLINVTCIIAE